MKTENMLMLGAVGIAGIIGYSMLKPEEKERIIPFGIPSAGAGIIPSIDLSGLLAGIKFPDIGIPDIVTTITQPFIDLKDKAGDIVDDVVTTTTGIIDTVKETGKAIVEAPKTFGENIAGAITDVSTAIAEGIVTVSPFGWGRIMGEALPVGTWIGDTYNWLLKTQPFAPSLQAPSPAKAKEFLERIPLAIRQQKSADILAGVIGEMKLPVITESVSRGQARPPISAVAPTTAYAPTTISLFQKRIAEIEAGRIKVPVGELAILKARVGG